MSSKGWYYAQLEAVQYEMRARPDMFFLYELTAPRVAVPKPLDLEKEFGRERVYNSSINELWMASAAIGAGLIGSRVIAYIPYQGGTIPFDVIRQFAGKVRYKTGGVASVPVVFFIEESGQSPTLSVQHSDYDEDIYFAHMAGIKVVVPSTVYDAKGLMHAAIRDPDPVVYINPGRLKSLVEDVPDEPFEVPFGKAVLRKAGRDMTIVGYGPVMPYVQSVATKLTAQGINAEVVDLRSLFPLDRDALIASARKTHKLLSVEAGKYSYGVGAEVLATVAEAVPGTVFRRIAYSDAPPPAAASMFNWMQVTEDRILAAAQALARAK